MFANISIYVKCILGSILFVAVVTDLSRHKVYNWLTFPGLGIGLGLNMALYGWMGLAHGILGLLVGALLFMPAFVWGGMAAGDIKLFAVIGSFTHWVFALNAGLYTALAGGVIAVIVLLMRGELWVSVKNIGRFLRSLAVPKLAVEPLSAKHPMPYALAIALGTLCGFFFPPFITF